MRQEEPSTETVRLLSDGPRGATHAAGINWCAGGCCSRSVHRGGHRVQRPPRGIRDHRAEEAARYTASSLSGLAEKGVTTRGRLSLPLASSPRLPELPFTTTP